jgi:hypothetical protein
VKISGTAGAIGVSGIIYLHGEYLLPALLLWVLGIAAVIIICGVIAYRLSNVERWRRKNQPKPYYPRSVK